MTASGIPATGAGEASWRCSSSVRRVPTASSAYPSCRLRARHPARPPRCGTYRAAGGSGVRSRCRGSGGRTVPVSRRAAGRAVESRCGSSRCPSCATKRPVRDGTPCGAGRQTSRSPVCWPIGSCRFRCQPSARRCCRCRAGGQASWLW